MDPALDPVIRAKWAAMDQVITILQNEPEDSGQFFYLEPKPRINKAEKPDPYDFKPLTDQSSLNSREIFAKGTVKDEEEKYYTISKRGISTFFKNETEYISLTDWLIERNFYYRIS